MTAEKVNHPAHYGGANNPYETIKVIEAWKLGFNLGNTVKYISRADAKGSALEDLKKAAWYLAREIEARSAAVEAPEIITHCARCNRVMDFAPGIGWFCRAKACPDVARTEKYQRENNYTRLVSDKRSYLEMLNEAIQMHGKWELERDVVHYIPASTNSPEKNACHIRSGVGAGNKKTVTCEYCLKAIAAGHGDTT